MLAVTAGDELVSTKNEHSHDVRPGKIEANQIMHQMKKEARQQIVPVNSSIIATCLQEVTDEKAVQLSLPSRVAINRTLNRQKQNLVPSLPIIEDRHFIIPTEYSDFCLFDSGVMDPERFLIFGERDKVMPSEFTILFGFVTVDSKFAHCSFTSFIPIIFKSVDFTHHAFMLYCQTKLNRRTQNS